MFHFPFGTMHELNLDWFLQEWEIYKQEWADAQAGIDNALQGEIDRVEDAMQDLYDARDAAVQAKEDAEDAADSAITDAAQAGTDALKSEGYAVGEQDGIPVGSGSPYYQDNAKYYKVEAGTYRYLSEAYAKGEMGGSPVAPGEAGYQDNAKYYKDAADNDATATANDRIQTGLDAAATAADALSAEGFAAGTQNGTPVSSGSPYYHNNTAYYAAEAQQDKEDTDLLKDAANAAALRAEGFSSGTQNGTPVGSDSVYYENNAAWYYGNTANVDGSNAQKMISASEEASSTAAYDHAAGSYFRMAGKLYQATADIEIGDTITAGTNCEEKTVEEELATQSERIEEVKETIIQLRKESLAQTDPSQFFVFENEFNVFLTGITAFMYCPNLSTSSNPTAGFLYAVTKQDNTRENIIIDNNSFSVIKNNIQWILYKFEAKLYKNMLYTKTTLYSNTGKQEKVNFIPHADNLKNIYGIGCYTNSGSSGSKDFYWWLTGEKLPLTANISGVNNPPDNEIPVIPVTQ